jgi:type VI secretion system secreted protein VgrG
MLWRGERGLRAAAGVGLLLAQSTALIAGAPITGSRDPILGCADSFAVLSAAGVSNKGRTYIYGNLGVESGAAITGFPPGGVFEGYIYSGGPVVREAQRDAFAAYDRLMRLPSFAIGSAMEGELGGLRLTPGVYALGTSARLSGTLLLDARDEDHAVFVFQIGTSLTTARGAAVVLVNQGWGDAVYWQVGGSAKLGRNTSFAGNILANKDIVMETGAKIRCGRAFTRTGSVTMDRNYIFSACEPPEIAVGLAEGPGGFNRFAPPPEPAKVGSSPEPGTFWLTAVCFATLIAVRFHRLRHPRENE